MRTTLRVVAAAGAVGALASFACAQDVTSTIRPHKAKVDPSTVQVGPQAGPSTGSIAPPKALPPIGEPRGGGGADNCAAATPMTGPGTHTFDTATATQDGTVSCGFNALFDVWYNYQATATGTATMSTCGGTTLDTVLAVFNSCGGTQLVCLDDFCGLQTQITFPITNGTHYMLRIAGYNSSRGSGTFTVTEAGGGGGPPNDNCASAQVITGAAGTVATTTVGATNDNNTCFGTPDVWYSWNAPATGTATFSFCAPQGGSASYDTAISMHTACGAAASVCNDDSCGLQSSMSFAVTGGTTYLVRVAGFSGTGTGTLGWTLAAGPCITPPAGGIAEGEPCGTDTNGGCNSAGFTPIAPGQVYLGNGWSSGGTRDTDWYQVTVANAGTLTWTGAANFPFRLFILNGSCPATINSTAAGAPCSVISTSFNVCPGTYNLFAGPDQFDGNPCDTSNDYWVQLDFAVGPDCPPAPGNDLCANATPVSEGVFPFDNTGANLDGPSPCGVMGTDVWYLYTPSDSGSVTATTCSPVLALDTVMAAYNAPCGGGTLACNDDGPPFCAVIGSPFSGSTINFFAVAGNQYLIQVGGYAGGQGTGELTISLQAGPCITPPAGGFSEGEDCGTDTNGGCNSAGFTAISAGQVVNGNAWSQGGTRDTDWYQFTHATPGTITWHGAANFPFRLFILNGSCPPAIIATVGGGPCNEITVTADVPAGTTNLFAGPDQFDGNPCGTNNDYWAQLDFTPGAGCSGGPPNNCCENATPVGVGTFPFDNTGATNDGFLNCGAAGSDVWYDFTAPSNDTFIVSTCDQTSVDTVLGVFDSCGGTQMTCLDDFCGLQTQITFVGTAGTHYRIALAGFAGNQGAGTLTISVQQPCGWTPAAGAIPEGEPCGTDTNGGCNSIPPIYTDVTCNGTWTGTAWFDGATRDTDWYRFTLTAPTTVTATSDTAFNGVLYFVNGIDTCAPGVPFFTNTSCGNPATLSATLDPGTWVIFVANDFTQVITCGTDDGYNLTVDIGAAPCTPPCSCDFNHDGLLNSQDFFDFLNCFFTPGCAGADFNHDGIANSQDFFDFLNCFFAGC